MEVNLMEMLTARENRVRRQQAVLEEYEKPLVSFTMNIAGPVKDSPRIRRGYEIGKILLTRQLRVAGIPCIHFEEVLEHTGCEAIFVLDAPGETVKGLTTEIEDAMALGRLFDMDVLSPQGEKYDRPSPRKCLICGAQAQACARSRTHTVPELQEKTAAILDEAILQWDGEKIASLAARALLYEVGATPKPGLVDRVNSGSHRDMDFFTFQNSTLALYPYFKTCFSIGRETEDRDAPETFSALRVPGKLAEGAMYAATGGINTHKGAIFSLGILCGALGRLPRADWKNPERILAECAHMTKGLTAGDFGSLTEETAVTAGQKLYLHHGITGVRGQAEAGFPAVREAGLPKLEGALMAGYDLNAASCYALLAIAAASDDTNLISRSDVETQRKISAEIGQLLSETPYPGMEILKQYDEAFMARRLSPGGSADLLAMTLLLHFLKEEESCPTMESAAFRPGIKEA